MARDKLESGRRYFCREETTGKGYSGIFHVDNNDMAMQIFAFDENLILDFDDLIVARLEDNRIVSLHKNITGGPTTSSHFERGVSSSSIQVTSNIVVFGEEPWLPTDDVRRVQFSIAYGDDLLSHSPKYDAIVEADFDNMPETTLFDLTVAGTTVKAWYAVSGGVLGRR